MDIDKIVNKQSRKRMLSFDLAGVSRLEKFAPHCLNNIDVKKVVFACDTADENAYFMVSEKEGANAESPKQTESSVGANPLSRLTRMALAKPESICNTDFFSAFSIKD